ncbi:hypothetical protein IGI04_014841 [Brassica rapa subsp. trilocularis]|uniref:NAD(P)H dehydrogenase (quinone) n=1 Tax=Brassica rapa subsp. trilocularis TaxID=1813537 RepID=A0ABQ7MNC2_BRACM|nr:hypothetical protein IGI04_014841 [Brassica rapa subsp. trilocularis]
MYRHVVKLAHGIRNGAASVDGVDAKLWQVVPETIQEDVIFKMSAPPKSDAPLITSNDLAEADGFVFGFPTTFGMMESKACNGQEYFRLSSIHIFWPINY